jgi:hypothetical protein
VGDISLQPLAPIQFSEIRPCGDLPPEGGQCRFSVRIRNRQPTPFQGKVWFVIEGSGIGSFADFTRFQPQRPRDLTLDPEGPTNSKVVHFSFQVPNTVRNGASICTQIFVGEGDSPFFDTVGRGELFCIVKGFSGGFSIVSAEEVKNLRQQVNERALIPPKKKG